MTVLGKTNLTSDFRSKYQGFTLVELLIVIVVVGILAGIVIAVINPANIEKKANDATLKANMDKLCHVLYACVSSKLLGPTNAAPAYAGCDQVTETGMLVPAAGTSPTGSSYTLTFTPATPSLGLVGAVTTNGTACQYSCTVNTSTGVTTQLTVSLGTCGNE